MIRPQMEPVRFLLVDDLEENLLALEGLLRREGLILLTARSGPQRLELLLKFDVALALLDVHMPGMDGFELAELMRGTERTRRIPIIFLTAGSADQQRRFRGYEAGAVDFLCKPVEPDILRSKADVFFDLYRQRQEVARQRDELRVATEENARLLNETQKYAEALREADRRKDEFLATLAHELRNPLAPLRTGLQILKLSPQSSEAAQARNMMDRQLAHMVRLIDDLLDVSRVSSGKLVLKTSPVTLQAVVQSAVEASRPLIEEAHHALIVQAPPEPIELNADATRLAQVVGNLLNNATKYTPNGGRIELAVTRAEQTVQLTVTDNGVGISEEMLPRVFEMFTQVGGTLERAQGGLGIGLALVKRLVEMHGGTISVTSAGAGRGSQFTVVLPLGASTEKQPGARPAEIAAPAAKSPRRRLLVVDDNIDAAESLAMLLRYSGHDAHAAHEGQNALTMARAQRSELVILDIGLPGLNGYEVAKLFRQDPELADTVLVALTGWGSDDDKRRSLEAGFDFHLTKPVDATAIQEVLERFLS